MRILIVNPPHPSIGSRIPDDHLPPLGLLSIGGPLIDDGHQVSLFDGEFGPASDNEIQAHIKSISPDILLLGHSGSTSAHPIAAKIAHAAKTDNPHFIVIYGGVFPTYHWRDILSDELYFDYIVRGEGEETCRALIDAITKTPSLYLVQGIAFRHQGKVVSTSPRPITQDVDQFRIG